MNITIKGFILKEFKQTLRDPKMRVILFGIPIIQLILFGLALSTEVKNIRLSIVAKPNDDVALSIYRRAIASTWFKEVGFLNSDPVEAILNNRTEAVIITPSSTLTRDLEKDKGGGQIQLLINGVNIVRAQGIERYLNAIIGSELSERSKRNSSRIESNLSLLQSSFQSPLQFKIRVLYNPSMESAIFMVPGVMCMILCVLTILLTSMAIAKEKEQGTYEMLLSTPISPLEIIAGKTIPYILLGLIDVPIIICAAVLIFAVPVHGPLTFLFISSFAFILATVSIGLLISTFAQNQQQAMMGGFIFLFPAILLSGIMFPIENIPNWIRPITYLNPLSYFATLLRNIMLKGGNVDVFIINTTMLFLIATIIIFIGLKRCEQN
ncbi:MAG: ABC transporter permease [Oligoflexia bacterium]|nr:ABC transporter permease [Oligoflexia bacterium]